MQGPPKPDKSRKGGHKGNKLEIRLRRAKVAIMRAKGVKPEAIWNALHDDFPHATLNTIHDDIEYIKAHAKEYVILEYLPEYGDQFQQALIILHEINSECWRRYKAGEMEFHRTKLPDGTVIEKAIKREGDLGCLKLSAEVKLAIIDLPNSATVSDTITRVASEYKRLREQTEKVMMPVGTEV